MSENKTAIPNLLKSKKVLLTIVIVLGVILLFVVQHFAMRAKVTEAYQTGLAMSAPQTINVSESVTITASSLSEIIAPASDLTAYKYYYKDAGVYENKHKLFGKIALPFNTDMTVYTYSGVIGAGIDLSEVTFDVDNSKEVIIINFPEPKILYHETGKDFEFYDVKKASFTRSSFTDFEEFREALMQSQEDLLMDNESFWESVRENTEAVITGMITASGQIDNYKIVCDW